MKAITGCLQSTNLYRIKRMPSHLLNFTRMMTCLVPAMTDYPYALFALQIENDMIDNNQEKMAVFSEECFKRSFILSTQSQQGKE